MSEFEDKLNSILSDPEQMANITRLAGQLMGTTAGESESQEPSAAAKPENGMFDSGMLGRLQGLMGTLSGQDDGKSGLVKALAPYLREDRRARLEKAMRLAKAAKLAGAAIGEFGGDGGGI